MATFTAANNGLREQCETFIKVFPYLIEEEQLRAQSIKLAEVILDNSYLTTANYNSFATTLEEIARDS